MKCQIQIISIVPAIPSARGVTGLTVNKGVDRNSKVQSNKHHKG